MNFSSESVADTAQASADAIRIFEKLGESGPHSLEGIGLDSILNHCTTNDIPFTLVFVPHGGYYVKRGVVDGVMPAPIRATLEKR